MSDHQHSPFAAISEGPFNEMNGEVKGYTLIYSGSFIVEIELTDVNRLRINMGLNPLGFNWHLVSGKTSNLITYIILYIRISDIRISKERINFNVFLSLSFF